MEDQKATFQKCKKKRNGIRTSPMSKKVEATIGQAALPPRCSWMERLSMQMGPSSMCRVPSWQGQGPEGSSQVLHPAATPTHCRDPRASPWQTTMPEVRLGVREAGWAGVPDRVVPGRNPARNGSTRVPALRLGAHGFAGAGVPLVCASLPAGR